MSDFHCPVGAVTRGADECINCGMCIATTKEELIAATTIIREFTKDMVRARLQGLAMKKIAICGKGGSGKSTITTLLARVLAASGYRCLVIDSDDSNVGLHRKLGIDECPEPLISYLGRFSIGKESLPSGEWMTKDPLALSEIPHQFVATKGNISLVVSGKIDNPFQGCSCPMVEVTKTLMFNLAPAEGEIILLDLEAGVENFGRGMEQACDTVLIITEPSFESIDLATKIQYLAEGVGVRRIRAIINKTVDEKQEEFIQDQLSERGIRFLGCVSANRELAMSNLKGQPLGSGIAYKRAEQIVGLMLDEAEMPHQV